MLTKDENFNIFLIFYIYFILFCLIVYFIYSFMEIYHREYRKNVKRLLDNINTRFDIFKDELVDTVDIQKLNEEFNTLFNR